MGCGGSKEKEVGVHAPLDHWMDNIGVDSVDTIFKDASEAIEKLEDVREVIVDDKTELVLYSGACSHKEPTIEESLKGITWKISADNDADFASAEFDFNFDAKSVWLKGSKNSAEAKEAVESLNNFLVGVVNVKDSAQGIFEAFESLANKITENKDKYFEDIKEAFKDKPMDSLKAINNLKKNFTKLNHGLTVVKELPEKMKKTVEQLSGFPSFISKPENITEIDKHGKKAKDAGKKRAYEITHFLYEEKDRYGKKVDDGFNHWKKKKETKDKRKAEKKNKKK